MTKFNDSQTSAMTGLATKREEFTLRPNYVDFASLLFLLIGLIFFILLLTNTIPPA
ncbi:hypothetical protein [Bacillus sp. FJAT-29790]|uniref:hypothetical protein n=1 Tax=Bacillus sp. FJAT-29790 TaxID=1895002 RepID=UPI0020B4502D|nr:hypothetical protein [Bacillus sp. FJAT-29790]